MKSVAAAGFSAEGLLSLGSISPAGVAVGDFNGDGKADLAVAITNGSTSSVTILLGKGDGTFQPPVSYPVPAATFVAVADFNGDGNPDIAVANFSTTQTLSLLLGNGDGTFRTAINYSLNGIGTGNLVAADFNGDGKADLLAGNAVLLGNGDGTFQAPLLLPGSPFFQNTQVGDFNGDGKLDVVIANPFLAIAFGNGDGTFQRFSSLLDSTVGGALVAADFDGDGNLDLAVQTDRDTLVRLGNGDGTFQSMTISLGVTGNPIAAGDFNGDGIVDLAMSTSGGIVSLLEGNGDGTFHLALSYTTTGPPTFLATADFNGDGRVDLVGTNYSGLSGLTILLGVSSGISLTATGGSPANRRDRRVIRRSVASDRHTRWNSAERSHRQLHSAFDRSQRGVEPYHLSDQHLRCCVRQRHRQWGRRQLRGDRNLQGLHDILPAHQQCARKRDCYERHTAVHLDQLAIPQASRSNRSGLGRESGVWRESHVYRAHQRSRPDVSTEPGRYRCFRHRQDIGNCQCYGRELHRNRERGWTVGVLLFVQHHDQDRLRLRGHPAIDAGWHRLSDPFASHRHRLLWKSCAEHDRKLFRPTDRRQRNFSVRKHVRDGVYECRRCGERDGHRERHSGEPTPSPSPLRSQAGA